MDMCAFFILSFYFLSLLNTQDSTKVKLNDSFNPELNTQKVNVIANKCRVTFKLQDLTW